MVTFQGDGASRPTRLSLARWGALAALLVTIAMPAGVASAQSAPRIAILPVADASGTLAIDQAQAITSALRGGVQSAVAAEGESDGLRYVAEGIARTTLTGSPGARTVVVELVFYATGETRRGVATEAEGAGAADGSDTKLRSAIAIAFRRATSGLSIFVNDLSGQAYAPPSPPQYIQPPPPPPW